MWTSAIRGCLALMLLGLACAATAQGDLDNGQDLTLVSPAESSRLRALLAAPPPSASGAALDRALLERVEAAQRLSDRVLLRQALGAMMAQQPKTPRWPNDLAILEEEEGRFGESERLLKLAISLASRPVDRLFYEMRLARLSGRRFADDEAQVQVGRVREEAQALLANTKADGERLPVLRVIGLAQSFKADFELRRGRYADALAAARQGEIHATEALSAAQAVPSQRRVAAEDLAVLQRQAAAALRSLGRYREASEQLDSHIRFIREQKLPAGWASYAQVALASVLLAQRDFAGAEAQLRSALTLRAALEQTAITTGRLADVATLAATLWALDRPADAQREIDGLDALLRSNPTLRARARMPFERGLALLGTGRAAEAAPLFEELARNNLRAWGAGHYYTAQAEGLRAVALWRSSDAAQRDTALELLRGATINMLAPRNAATTNDQGLRPRIREMIFSTYVEAAAARGGLQALLALGVADSLRPGLTPQALADAALRGATSDPQLAALVREEQDGRNEMQAIQTSLSLTGIDAPPAAAAERLRSRLVEVDQRRQQQRAQLRDRYPAFDQLASPPLPDSTAIAQQLARNEVLVFMLPTEQAVLVWAVSPDELPQFLRVDLPAARLRELVQRVRKSVEFGAGPLKRFDVQAAHELYARLLAPLAGSWGRAQQLILATSGDLASLPFAALVTEPPKPGNRETPWLARRWAVSQVPSVAAWLSLRALPPARAAPEPLLAWGDPAFAAQATPAPARAVRKLVGERPALQTFRYGDLPALPETRDELQAIAAALKADAGRDLVLGGAATRESVLAASRSGVLARKKVVAFATHGLMSGDLPGLEQPALALAAGGTGAAPLSALLSLDDVLGLKLNADWVVLSACNSAAGDGRAGEALSGLARGFLYAGSRSLLVTQWAVESESAKRLTTGTFEHRAAHPGAAKAESLRQAMLALAAEPRYAHPAFWAPFILVGDGRP